MIPAPYSQFVQGGLVRDRRNIAAGLALLLLLTFAYWPGLSGVFLFDDWINLNQLGRYGGVHDFTRFLYFLTSGEADPTGRPVAQLSWLIDARDWPADPWPFKRTNLLIHLFNGVLVYALLRRLQQWVSSENSDNAAATWTPLFAAALWTAHPLWVSTTLYIVQRQTILAATFALLGLIAWDITYCHLRAGRALRGWLWLAVGVGGATLLAGMSKANGFLLPLLALVLWWSLQAGNEDRLPLRQRIVLRRHVLTGIGLPSLALVIYLLSLVPSAILRAAAVRDWTIGERLLSQPRALLDYLGLLLAPREGSGGLFNDGFQVSHGLLDPWTTLPALLVVVGLIVLGLSVRKRWPLLSVALLFFFAGHAMESSALPLELYFEHRNYLPAALLFWPIAYGLLAAGRARHLRIALASLLVALWLLLTWQRAVVWGNPPLQAALWAERNPDSPRAQAYAASWLQKQGRHAEAQALLARANRDNPGEVVIALNAVGDACTTGVLDEATLQAAERSLRSTRKWNQGLLDWLDRAANLVARSRCPGLGDRGMQRLLDATAANPAFTRSVARVQALHRLRARRALALGDADAALAEFNRGLDLQPKPQVALAQAAELGNAGYPTIGLRHLDHYAALGVTPPPTTIHSMADVHHWLLERTGYYSHEMSLLRRALAKAASGLGADTQAGKREEENEGARKPPGFVHQESEPPQSK